MKHSLTWLVTFLTTGISTYDMSNDCDSSNHTYTFSVGLVQRFVNLVLNWKIL
ncbi:hypothetical protein DN31_1878 [Vibrio mimicus]|nr:hypothetical protein DN31_1878 [Vibrio mimicus]